MESSVRDSQLIHLSAGTAHYGTCHIGVGGLLLTPESIELPTADKKMIGSMFICEAETLAEVKKIVEGDIYYTAGVVNYTVPSSRFSLILTSSGIPKG